MGTRLRNLSNKLKSTKLSDGKKISRRGWLTDAQILLMQKYYGLEIRRNTSKSVDEMFKSIWAIYCHKLLTDAKPQHGNRLLLLLTNPSDLNQIRSMRSFILITSNTKFRSLKQVIIQQGNTVKQMLRSGLNHVALRADIELLITTRESGIKLIP
ncbi:hypothetical protein AVEN_164538-1 [Araneus ventricosus]|uniref:Uncharacterized protein n=1 Tax=Araneus ventricosus TaxID=182803 RepID=A0A4Y2B205_ARAVE|nr:hypothetical protein AVEN_164538-1 [Araneus ventricosus]